MVTRLLFLMFLAVPLIEIGFFVLIGQSIGLWPTLAGVVLTALAGALLIRWQGIQVIADLRRTAARGELPGRQIADAMLIGLAGLLLLLPGYFSDLIGILLLLPPVRALLYAQLARRFKMVASTQSPRPGGPGRLGGGIDLDQDDWRER
ncbi:MAG: FxsA family protein [Devosia sp.]